MDAVIRSAGALRGTLSFPADKAICHRAALLCALGEGVATIRPWSIAEDCRQTLTVLEHLGVRIVPVPHGIQIHGVGLHGLTTSPSPLHCGDSGTTMRLVTGVLAGQPFVSHLTAGPSLSQRPMRRIIEPLSRMGASLKGRRAVVKRQNSSEAAAEIYPPLVIEGKRPLRGIAYEMPMASAQVKSAILLAALYAEDPTTIVEPVPTRDHTERLLSRMGVLIRQEGRSMTVKPPARPLATSRDLTIPGDPSSAAFFIVAASIIPDSQLVVNDLSLNPSRIRFLEVLQRMGASIAWKVTDEAWEPRGTLSVTSGPLRGVRMTADEVPGLIDELPILMVAACAAEGTTRFEGLEELRVKETDRIRAMTRGLEQLGAQVESDGASQLSIQRSRLRGATVDSFGDHRIAMSFAVAGLFAEGQTTITGVESVAKSFGTFFDFLTAVTSPSTVKTVDKA